MQSGFDGPESAVHLDRNLLKGKVLEIVQDDRLSLT